ncbi:MAG: amidohydrolase family protein [Lachnospiraceae bacterium]|nr:amidohydrolase family protein [Lachnospiraceae bacterium]
MTESFIIHGDIVYSKDLTELACYENGWLVCDSGISGGVYKTREEIPVRYQAYPVVDHTDCLIIPGFTDLHLHAPQFAFRGLGMDKELIDWLDEVAFPEEAKYSDSRYAGTAYRMFAEAMKNSGTVRALIFGTRHTDATMLLMDAMEKTGLVSMVGKVNMDRNCPDTVREESSEVSLSETERWLQLTKERNYSNTYPILSPRFIPACSDDLMKGLANIQGKYHLPLQSHLSENQGEVKMVKKLCPWSTSYGQAYDRFGCFGANGPTVMAHCVWSSDEEMLMIKKNKVYVAHCPAANMNLSSGMAPTRKYISMGIKVGIGTDVGAGHCKSMFDAMVQTIEVSKLYWKYVDIHAKPVTMEEAFCLATRIGGSFFGKCGAFDEGYEFDALVLDEREIRTPIADLSLKERLERFIYLGEYRDIKAKYVRGSSILI